MGKLKRIAGPIIIGTSLLAAYAVGAQEPRRVDSPHPPPQHVQQAPPMTRPAPPRELRRENPPQRRPEQRPPQTAPRDNARPPHRGDDGWVSPDYRPHRRGDGGLPKPEYRPDHRWRQHPHWRRPVPSRPFIVPWLGWCNWDCGPYARYPGWFQAWCWDNPRFYSRFSPLSAQDTFAMPPPPGYDSEVVSYFKAGDFRTIRVELERQLPDNTIELTVLRDDNGDGTLEQAVSVAAPSRELAIKEYVQHDEGNFRKELGLAQALYDRSISGAGSMYRDIVDIIRAKGEW